MILSSKRCVVCSLHAPKMILITSCTKMHPDLNTERAKTKLIKTIKRSLIDIKSKFKQIRSLLVSNMYSAVNESDIKMYLFAINKENKVICRLFIHIALL